MRYAYDYVSNTKEDACASFIWDYFADDIPYSIVDYVDYISVVEKVLNLEVVEVKDKYIVLSDSDVDELSLR